MGIDTRKAEKKALLNEIKVNNSQQAKIFKAERKEQITKIIFETTTENDDLVYMSETDFEVLKHEYEQVKDAESRGIIFETMEQLLNGKSDLEKQEYFAFINKVKGALNVKEPSNGFNVYLWGDKGNGKSHFCKELAKELEREIVVQNFAMTGYDFQGLVDIQGNYHYSLIEQAFKFGFVAVFEEIESYDPTANIYLNSVLEQGYITTRTGEVIKRHPNTIIIATGNTDLLTPSLNYANRNTLDIATIDRFLRIKMPNFEFLNRLVSGNNYEIISKTIDNEHGQRSVRNFVRLNKIIKLGLNLQEHAKSILENQ